MQTLCLKPDRQFELKTLDLPLVPPGGAILKVNACGVCGTDIEKWQNRPNPEQVVLGHELVGELVSICPSYKGRLLAGNRVVVAHHVPCGQCRYCLNDSESMCQQFKRSNINPGGFSNYVVLSDAHLKKTTFLVPGNVPDARAIHVEPLACVLKAIRRGGQYKQAKTLVVGLGYIGLMAAQLYTLRGDRVYSIDTSVDRLKSCKSFNLQRTAFLPDQLPEGDFDIVFLSVVNAQSVAKAMQRVRQGGTIIIFADSPDQPIQIDCGTLYHREISVIPSYSPGLQDLKEAAKLVFAESIALTPLVTHWSSLADAPSLFEVARQPQSIKTVVFPNGFPEKPVKKGTPPQTKNTDPNSVPQFVWPETAVDELSASLSL